MSGHSVLVEIDTHLSEAVTLKYNNQLTDAFSVFEHAHAICNEALFPDSPSSKEWRDRARATCALCDGEAQP